MCETLSHFQICLRLLQTRLRFAKIFQNPFKRLELVQAYLESPRPELDSGKLRFVESQSFRQRLKTLFSLLFLFCFLSSFLSTFPFKSFFFFPKFSGLFFFQLSIPKHLVHPSITSLYAELNFPKWKEMKERLSPVAWLFLFLFFLSVGRSYLLLGIQSSGLAFGLTNLCWILG